MLQLAGVAESGSLVEADGALVVADDPQIHGGAGYATGVVFNAGKQGFGHAAAPRIRCHGEVEDFQRFRTGSKQCEARKAVTPGGQNQPGTCKAEPPLDPGKCFLNAVGFGALIATCLGESPNPGGLAGSLGSAISGQFQWGGHVNIVPQEFRRERRGVVFSGRNNERLGP